MNGKAVRVGLIQMSCSTNPEENTEKAVARLREAARSGAQVVCLQELYRSQYFCRDEHPDLFDLAETVPGPSTEAFSTIAAENRIVIIVPIFEKRARGLYHNSAVVIDADGATLGIYRKMHIPDDPLFFEKFYFTPGDLGFRNFDTRYGRIATLICWDQWYPEGARVAALGGADIVFYPTAIGWHPAEKEQYGAAQRDAWQTIQRAHAIANGVFVAAVNRVGYEGPPYTGGQEKAGLEFWGTSFICDPFGQVMAQASTADEEILIAECDPAKAEEIRRNWPFLRDRRIDAYAPILQRWID
ncbi:MAG: carbon-nitrogen hydrolase [Bryobacterales bacterium]|nr:carbon-nitrogen hydrolase [Bryobacterales bacterium]